MTTATPAVEALMPALFIGHGNPMNAIEDTEFSRAWTQAAQTLPTPKAVLCVSAHWETDGTRVTAMVRPRTIHDFYGFPPALYQKQYPAPGLPALVPTVREAARPTEVTPDLEWGLDHGAWAVLGRLFPDADIPVVQVSLDRRKDPAAHYALGRQLRALRRQGVLIVGSGNLVHNLREMAWSDLAYDWAVEFEAQVKARIRSGDHQGLVDYTKLGASARLAVPTVEHYLPLLYVLGATHEAEPVSFFAEKVTLGSMSMCSVRVG